MLTNQEIFDIAVGGLLKQGRISQDEYGICQYRGPGGLKCAVGFVIKDEYYNPNVEGQAVLSPDASPVDSPSTKRAALENALSCSGVDYAASWTLLSDMQQVHDAAPEGHWPKRFRGIAVEYNLSPAAIDAWEEAKKAGAQ